MGKPFELPGFAALIGNKKSSDLHLSLKYGQTQYAYPDNIKKL